MRAAWLICRKDLRARLRPGSVHDKYVRLVSTAHYGCVV